MCAHMHVVDVDGCDWDGDVDADDGAVGDENENVLVPGEEVQAVDERLRQQIRVLVQPGQKRGLGTQGYVHVTGGWVQQMHLTGQSVASWEGDFVLDGQTG